MNQEYLHILMLSAKFQILEYLLKIYVGKSYNHIKEKIDDKFSFNYSYEDVKDCSLDRITKIFKKLNNDISLQTRIGLLVKQRNHFAHKALLIAMPSFPSRLKTYFLGDDKNPEDYGKLKSEIDDCLAILAAQIKSLISPEAAS